MAVSFDGCYAVPIVSRNRTSHFKPGNAFSGEWACAMILHDQRQYSSPFPPGSISVFLISTAGLAASLAALDLRLAILNLVLSSGAQERLTFPVRKTSVSGDTCIQWNVCWGTMTHML